MINLCKYKDIFGKPAKGVHKYRIFNFAFIDIIMTIIFGFIIAQIFNIDIWNSIVVLFIVGILLHRLFCVRTTLDKLFFN